MFLKAGAISLLLLLASRLLGLLRESAQAAAFGTSGMGDVAVIMLTLPDWLTGVLASGALAYVLLPHWASQSSAQQTRTQRRVAHWLLGIGSLIGLLLCVFQTPVLHALASGLPTRFLPKATQGLVWSAATLPAAMLAALWVTRLQHERDFTGLYAANLVVNSVLIAALYVIANINTSTTPVSLLGLALCLAMGLRLLWLHWRLQAHTPSDALPAADVQAPMPGASLWVWATLSAGLPLALPFVARSFASNGGEGALVTFNFAWKLVELPLVLAIQLVATLAFPSITRAMARKTDESTLGQALPQDAIRAIRGAFLLAWTLACAAIVALQLGAPAIATLLFGWGRMSSEALAAVAAWGSIGAWGLLPQALTAVALTVLATQGRMHSVVMAYAVALAALLLIGVASNGSGAGLMAGLNAVLTLVALIALLNLRLPGQKLSHAIHLLPWRAMATPTTVLASLVGAARGAWVAVPAPQSHGALVIAMVAAIGVIATSYAVNEELRASLRR